MNIFSKLRRLVKKESVCVFYIATGSYIVLWDEFKESCDRHFMPGVKKKYKLFIDIYTLEDGKDYGSNVEVIPLRGSVSLFPWVTLYRYHVFSAYRRLAAGCDYVFFFNSNVAFKRPVSVWDMFGSGNVLVGVEPLPKARGDVPEVMGGLIGGTRDAWDRMCERIKELVSQSNKLPKQLDQHFLNVYFRENRKEFTVLPYGFLYPEYMRTPPHSGGTYITLRNKASYGVFRPGWDLEEYPWKDAHSQIVNDLDACR